VGRLRPRSARGRLQAKPKRLCFFVILVTHPKSYIQTTDRRDYGGKPSEWRLGRVLWRKILEFCSVGGARSKKAFFAFSGSPSTILRTAYRKQFDPKPMESRESEGVPFASLESLTRHLADIGPWKVPKMGHVTITKIENLHIFSGPWLTQVEKFTFDSNKKLSWWWQTCVTHLKASQSRSPNITIPHVRYSFLLCNSNFVFNMRRFSEIRLQKCHDLEIRVRGHSRP